MLEEIKTVDDLTGPRPDLFEALGYEDGVYFFTDLEDCESDKIPFEYLLIRLEGAIDSMNKYVADGGEVDYNVFD